MAAAAAIYARISSDPNGTALGVRRQEADCRALAEGKGWTVTDVYVDNDISAFSGKRRPEYVRLLEDIEAGHIDAVIVWQLDRLHRSPKELEAFIDLTEKHGTDLATVTGDVDLATSHGRLVARIMGAVGSQESEQRSLRSSRKMKELAEAGQRKGGGTRPYGFETDRVTIRPDEAVIIRECVDRILAGDSLTSICRDLQERDVPTVTGAPWHTQTLKRILTAPRTSGQQEHKGQIVADAMWPAIIPPADTARVRAVLDASGVQRTTRTPRRYLLAGLLRCSHCTAVLRSRPRSDGRRRYVCSLHPNHGGCGKIAVMADDIEALITAAVVHRLDTPELAAALAADNGIEHSENASVQSAIEADRLRSQELAAAYGNGVVSMREWEAARKPIIQRLAANERRLARSTRTIPLSGFVGNASELRARWAELNLTRQQAIVKAVLDHAEVGPALKGRNTFDPNRVTPIWRL